MFSILKVSGKEFNLQERVFHRLLLNALFESSPSLLNGRLGIVIAMFHSAQYLKNEVYEEMAITLLESICGDITRDMPVDFANGLTGIGWGIEYLIQRNFVEGNGNQVCYKIDEIIVDRYTRDDHENRKEADLSGLLHYISAKLTAGYQRDSSPILSDVFLKELYIRLKRSEKEQEALKKGFEGYVLLDKPVTYEMNVLDFIHPNIQIRENNPATMSLNLKDGLAGWLLQHMLTGANFFIV